MIGKLHHTDGFVYFIQSAKQGPIKIGFSADVQQRMAGLQTAHPYPLRLLAQHPGSPKLEKLIHELFEHLRIDGEWFRYDKQIVEYARRGAPPPFTAVDPKACRFRVALPAHYDLRGEGEVVWVAKGTPFGWARETTYFGTDKPRTRRAAQIVAYVTRNDGSKERRFWYLSRIDLLEWSTTSYSATNCPVNGALLSAIRAGEQSISPWDGLPARPRS